MRRAIEAIPVLLRAKIAGAGSDEDLLQLSAARSSIERLRLEVHELRKRSRVPSVNVVRAVIRFERSLAELERAAASESGLLWERQTAWEDSQREFRQAHNEIYVTRMAKLSEGDPMLGLARLYTVDEVGECLRDMAVNHA